MFVLYHCTFHSCIVNSLLLIVVFGDIMWVYKQLSYLYMMFPSSIYLSLIQILSVTNLFSHLQSHSSSHLGTQFYSVQCFYQLCSIVHYSACDVLVFCYQFCAYYNYRCVAYNCVFCSQCMVFSACVTSIKNSTIVLIP